MALRSDGRRTWICFRKTCCCSPFTTRNTTTGCWGLWTCGRVLVSVVAKADGAASSFGFRSHCVKFSSLPKSAFDSGADLVDAASASLTPAAATKCSRRG